MTPGARIAAAIEILDQIQSGAAAEKSLTSWARSNRFAGSKDRAAIRDHVFDALRNLQSFQAMSGETGWPPTGRTLMIGMLRATGQDPATVFNSEGYAPSTLTDAERERTANDAWQPNLPDWLWDKLQAQYPETAREQASLLAERAPVSLRANLAKAGRDQVAEKLRAEGYEVSENLLSPTALTVRGRTRGLTATSAFQEGLFELQDATSQAVVDGLEVSQGAQILDFCAGGGGKSLALAALNPSAKITAHDIDPQRMKDISNRAKRAGVAISLEENSKQLPRHRFDIVFLDVPCSGSGSWRRAPEAKWLTTQENLDKLLNIQKNILSNALDFVTSKGEIYYATCSVLEEENAGQIDCFIRENPSWRAMFSTQWPISVNGDGFFLTRLART